MTPKKITFFKKFFSPPNSKNFSFFFLGTARREGLICLPIFFFSPPRLDVQKGTFTKKEGGIISSSYYRVVYIMGFERGKCYVSSGDDGSVLHVTSERRCSSYSKMKRGGMMVNLEGPSSGWYNDRDKKKNKKQKRQQRRRGRASTKATQEREHLRQVNKDDPSILQYHRLETLVRDEFLSKKYKNNKNGTDGDDEDDGYNNNNNKKKMKKNNKTKEKKLY